MIEPGQRKEAVPEHCEGDEDVTLPMTVNKPRGKPRRAPSISTPERDADEFTDVNWPPSESASSQ